MSIKIKLLIWINCILGVFLAGTWTLAFSLFLQGHSIQETNQLIAYTELAIAAGLTAAYIFQAVYFIKKK